MANLYQIMHLRDVFASDRAVRARRSLIAEKSTKVQSLKKVNIKSTLFDKPIKPKETKTSKQTTFEKIMVALCFSKSKQIKLRCCGHTEDRHVLAQGGFITHPIVEPPTQYAVSYNSEGLGRYFDMTHQHIMCPCCSVTTIQRCSLSRRNAL